MITPIGKRVIVQPLEDKISGTIVIPDQFLQQQTGKVISVGKDVTFIVKPGDVVLFHPNAAWTNVEHAGETLRAMNEEYLLAVMEET